MQNKILVGCMFFLLVVEVHAQEFIEQSTLIRASYNSSVIYPGARLGLEFPLHSKTLNRFKKNRSKEIRKIQSFTSSINWYHHPDFHDNIYWLVGWLQRRSKPSGFFTEFTPEIGYSRTFLGGTTYQVDEVGDVSINRLAGFNYLTASLGGGFGWSLEEKLNIPISAYYRLNILILLPYNSTVYFRPAMELGIIYTPTKFLNHCVKLMSITK